MEEHVVKILDVKELTHDVKKFLVEKPPGYDFVPGQATEVAVNKTGWKKQRRPFTFTSLNDSPFLEFTIKGYPERKGVTAAIHQLKRGDELLIHDVWGAIAYKGKGVFIAGGAGITPFIAIFRQLFRERRIAGNKLIFSNKTVSDIIMRDEFEAMLGKDFINVLTGDNVPGIRHERIDKAFLQEVIQDFKQHFYICGPDPFTAAISAALVELGARVDEVVFEK
jgi:hypothetical protein